MLQADLEYVYLVVLHHILLTILKWNVLQFVLKATGEIQIQRNVCLTVTLCLLRIYPECVFQYVQMERRLILINSDATINVNMDNLWRIKHVFLDALQVFTPIISQDRA